MAKTRRMVAILVAVIFTIIGPVISVLIAARLAVYLGWTSYPIYFACQVLSSFLILWLYNPAKRSLLQRIFERLASPRKKNRFFQKITKIILKICDAVIRLASRWPRVTKAIRLVSRPVLIFGVNFGIGPFVGAMYIKRLGYDGPKAYAYAALADAICVIIGNSVYLYLLGSLLKKLF